MNRQQPNSTLFPYTTLFRSQEQAIIEYVFEKDGQEVRSQKFLPEAEGYKYKDSKVLNADKTVPKITDYAVSSVDRSEEHTSELQSLRHLVCRLLLEKKNK